MNITLRRALSVCVLAGSLALALALAAGAGSAEAKSSVVGPGESIQKAINAADPGDTIVVRGVHKEDVITRKKGIKLRGDDAVIEAPATAKADSPCSKASGPTAICLLGDFNPETGEVNKRVSDVSVSGFTIRGFKAVGIDVAGARDVTISGNDVEGSSNSGIFIGEGTNATISSNDLTDNNLGMLVVKSTGTKILSNNDIMDSTFVGTVIFDSTGTKILSNDISRSGDVGISIFGPERANNGAKVVGNNISGGPAGIYVANTKG